MAGLFCLSEVSVNSFLIVSRLFFQNVRANFLCFSKTSEKTQNICLAITIVGWIRLDAGKCAQCASTL